MLYRSKTIQEYYLLSVDFVGTPQVWLLKRALWVMAPIPERYAVSWPYLKNTTCKGYLEVFYNMNNLWLMNFSAKQDPFSLQFLTDSLEANEESIADVANSQAGSGFQLTYTMSSNNC